MSKARYTSGKWRVDKRFSHGSEVKSIAQVAWCGANGSYGEQSQTIDEEEAFGNACLISASPEMYEVLYDMLEVEDMEIVERLVFDDMKLVAVCRHCGREYPADDPDMPPPKDAMGCSDDCLGHRARRALARAAGRI